jgi:hypothetical protein
LKTDAQSLAPSRCKTAPTRDRESPQATTATLKRSDFGLGKFVPLVSDEVRMHIISEVAEAKAYAEYLKAEEAAEKAEAAKNAKKE